MLNFLHFFDRLRRMLWRKREKKPRQKLLKLSKYASHDWSPDWSHDLLCRRRPRRTLISGSGCYGITTSNRERWRRLHWGKGRGFVSRWGEMERGRGRERRERERERRERKEREKGGRVMEWDGRGNGQNCRNCRYFRSLGVFFKALLHIILFCRWTILMQVQQTWEVSKMSCDSWSCDMSCDLFSWSCDLFSWSCDLSYDSSGQRPVQLQAVGGRGERAGVRRGGRRVLSWACHFFCKSSQFLCDS